MYQQGSTTLHPGKSTKLFLTGTIVLKNWVKHWQANPQSKTGNWICSWPSINPCKWLSDLTAKPHTHPIILDGKNLFNTKLCSNVMHFVRQRLSVHERNNSYRLATLDKYNAIRTSQQMTENKQTILFVLCHRITPAKDYHD